MSQNGGDQKVIPLYKEPRNSPFKTKESQHIDASRSRELLKDLSKGQTTNDPLIDFKVYEQRSKQSAPGKKEIDATSFLPHIMPNPYTNPTFGAGSAQPYYYPSTANPIIKNYTINTSGPMDDHLRVGTLYEDVLPKPLQTNTFSTLKERGELRNFIRSIFIRSEDGEDISLGGGSQNSLMSYLKFLEINPYAPKSAQEIPNPYANLPDNMLLYKSCYPIKHNNRNNTVECSPNSIGMNVRIYKVNYDEFMNMKTTKSKKFNLWRELFYYEYVRDNIVLSGICPHFSLMYSYYTNHKCDIPFDKILLAKGKNKYRKITDPKEVEKYKKEHGLNSLYKGNIQKALVILTEAPNYNLYEWAQKNYSSSFSNFNVKYMTNTGYHSESTWLTILFQLMYTIYVMQVHGIVFNNFNIDNNIFVKDISTESNKSTYWIYNVDNFEFFVPNHGYIVMVDSNYADITTTPLNLGDKTSSYKIYGNNFNDKTYTNKSVNKLIFTYFKNIFNVNNFTKLFVNRGGVPPPDSIKRLIERIQKDAADDKNMDIKYYITTHMRQLFNNRIGTYLTFTEARNVNNSLKGRFKKGDVVVYSEKYKTYKFVLFVEMVGRQAKVYTKTTPDDKNIEEKVVSYHNLYGYSLTNPIRQNFTIDKLAFTNNNLLEKYII